MTKSEKSPERKDERSMLSTFCYITCATFGAGLYNVPNVYKSVGIYIFYVVFFVVLYLVYYSGTLVQKAMDNIGTKNKKCDSLVDLAYLCLGYYPALVTRIVLYSDIVGISWIYTILAGKNLSSLTVSFGQTNISIGWFYFFVGLIGIIVLVVVPDINKHPMIISTLGILSTTVACLSILVYSCISLAKNGTEFDTSTTDFSGLSLTISTLTLSFGSTPVYPGAYNSSKNKAEYKKALGLALIFVAFVTAFVATISTLAFKNTLTPIYLALPQNSIPVKIAIMFITIHFICASCIYLSLITKDGEPIILKYTKNKTTIIVSTIIMKIILVSITTLLAVYVSSFEFATGLIGSVSVCLIVFFVPLFCYLKSVSSLSEIKWLDHIKHIAILAIGLLCLIYGTYSAFTVALKT